MRIGFIGLGNMGGPMALNVLKGGHTMVVSDLRHELAKPHLALGAEWADTPAAVARASEVVFTSLPGPREVEAVALGKDGILKAPPAARSTSISPRTRRRSSARSTAYSPSAACPCWTRR